jgi:NPCBM/NEW2 domain
MASLDFIDGVFIPDGGDGPIVVSSNGHTFHDCPDTNSKFCWDIFNGNATNLDERYRGLLDGRKYGTSTHPAITIHSNAGITFDLDKIRASLGGNQLAAFTTSCGLGDHPVVDNRIRHRADFWVLIDGQKRFEWKGVTHQNEVRQVLVKLTEQNKFLTLIVTDGEGLSNKEKSCGYDWGIFAEAALILEGRGW